MTRTSIVASAVLWLLTSGAARAASQTSDHMKCYRVTDRDGAAAVADFDTAQLGLVPGCKLRAKSRELCVPVTSDVIGSAETADAVTGENLADQRLCYRIKCPKGSLPPMQVSDRFGTRSLLPGQAKRFCTSVVPATGTH